MRTGVGRRRWLVPLLAGACLSGSALRAHADTPPYQLNDYSDGHLFGITPPGENGLVTGPQAVQFETSGARPPHNADTLPLYANLLYNYRGLTDAQLPQYFVDESFGVPPGKLERTETPRSDVTVYRDNYGIPHVYGQSDAAMAFGAGYVAAEDRLFFMDVLRHVGSGTTTTFLGPSCSDEKMDHDQLLLTGGYSHDDKLAQIQLAAAQDPVEGPRALSLATAYTAGINQYITEAATDPNKLPGDYAVVDPRQHGMPQPFDVADLVDIASVIGGQLGRGGGNETHNASLLQYLAARFGPADAASIFRDMKEQNDPDAPTTADTAFPYEIPGTIDPSLTAMPDYVASSPSGFPFTPTTPATTAGCDLSQPQTLLPSGLPIATAARSISTAALQFPRGMSNALLIDATHSSTGHPLAVFGSQAAYFAPEIWMAQDLHSPDYDAAGFSIPGISLVVLIGRGRDFAWSATSASSDNVDLRLETICDPAGGAPSPTGTSYLYRGTCTPMVHTQQVQTAVPTPAGQGAPTTFTQDVYTSVHGVIQGWTTSHGRPMAIVQQRSTYEREPVSLLGFLRWGTPRLTDDAQSWLVGTHEIEFPFNWLYVDDRDIAYGLSGRDPLRPGALDPNLPATGDGRAEWQGFLADDAHPHQVGSAKGYLTSWNNKPAPLFSASDSQYEYGRTYRNQSLVDAIKAQLAAHGGTMSEANLVSAMEDAATVDLEGTRILPELLPYMAAQPGLPATTRTMLAELQSWLADGAHRIRARQGDTQYAHADAVAIMDELYPHLIRAVFDPLFADPALGASATTTVDGMDSSYARVPFEWANNPNYDGSHLGSAYDGGWDGYVQKVLRQLQGESVGQPFSTASFSRMCSAGPGSCGASLAQAFADTATALAAANGGSTTVTSWTGTTATASQTAAAQSSNPTAAPVTLPDYDALHYRAIGIVGQPVQDWQNRPTQQQVVAFVRHRDRGTAGVTTPPPTAAGAVATPNTGGSVGRPGGAAAALLAVAVVAGTGGRRRRRS